MVRNHLDDTPTFEDYKDHITVFKYEIIVENKPVDNQRFTDLEESIINSQMCDQDKAQLLGGMSCVEDLQKTIMTHRSTMEETRQKCDKAVCLMCKHKTRSIRKEQRSKKRVTSVAIHDDNQDLIMKLQQEAKKCGFVLSKEFIINVALRRFGESFVDKPFFDVMCDISK